MAKKRLPYKEPEFEIVAFCSCGCGALVLVAADHGQKDRQLDKEIAELIRAGSEVKRVSRGEAKKLLGELEFGCTQTAKQEPATGQMNLLQEIGANE